MLENMRRLHPRGAANRGICVDAEGAMLGPEQVLVRHTLEGYRVIDRDDAFALQKSLLGAERDRDWLFQQCRRIAEALNRDELALAQIYGLHIPIGDLDDRQLKRIAATRVAKYTFNPDEPRIPKGNPHGGEWTTGGDGTDSGDASTSESPSGDAMTNYVGGDGGDGDGVASEADTSSTPTSGATAGEGPTTGVDPYASLEMLPADTANAGTDRPPTDQQSAPAVAALAGDEAAWLAGQLSPSTLAALETILARMSSAAIVFGILFIPTNQSPIDEGQIAGSPDLSYRHDSDTGVLQLRQDIGSLGPIVFEEAHIGADGLFRDAEGQIIGRYLSSGGVVIDVGALPGYRMLSGTQDSTDTGTDQDDQAKLCPDPNAVSIAGRSERSLAYQELITGLPRGLEVKLNDVRFDGCVEATGTMLEAKGPGFEDKMDGPSDWRDWFTGDEQIEAQMLNQQNAVAAAGRTVEWHFAEEPVADFFRKFAEERKLTNIVVFYTPPRQQ